MKLKSSHIFIAVLTVFFYLFYCLVFCTKAKASHIGGGEWLYEALGKDTFLIHYTFYRDCCPSCIAAPNSAEVYITSVECNLKDTLFLTLSSLTDIAPTCYEGETYCNGGTAFGMEKHVYSGVVVLHECSDWILSFQLCCLSGIITNVSNPSVADLYVPALLNNKDSSYSSPKFNSNPIYFACLDSLTCIDNSVSSSDSVVYSMASPMQNASEDVNFIAGYDSINFASSSTPITFINGALCLTPSSQQVDIYATTASTYNSKGELVSRVERFMQIIMQVCNCGDALPVTIVNFFGTNTGLKTFLTWEIVSQINNRCFRLRRHDGSLIAEIRGAGTSSTPEVYGYQDIGFGEYRLECVSYDGAVQQLGDIYVAPDTHELISHPFWIYDGSGRHIGTVH